MNNIEYLLEQYFEGNTSAKEEATLRDFFTTRDVPEHLTMYTSLFTYFDNEIKTVKTDNEEGSGYHHKNGRLTGTTKESRQSIINDTGNNAKVKPLNHYRKRMLWLGGAAACAILFISMFFMTRKQGTCPGEGDYVIIDGRCYTDMETIRSATLKTLREVSNDDDVFSESDTFEADKIIGNQLREFDFLFNE